MASELSSPQYPFARGPGSATDNTQRVILSTDSPGVSGSGTGLDVNVTKFKGVAVSTGAGSVDTGTLRVTLTSNSPFDLQTTRLSRSLFDFNTATDNVLVAGLMSQTIRVHRIILQVTDDVTITFKSNGVAISHTYRLITDSFLVLDFSLDPWFVTNSGHDLQISLSAAVQVVGTVYYVQS